MKRTKRKYTKRKYTKRKYTKRQPLVMPRQLLPKYLTLFVKEQSKEVGFRMRLMAFLMKELRRSLKEGKA